LEQDEPFPFRVSPEGGGKGYASLLVHLELVPSEESAHSMGTQWVEVV